VDLQVLGLGFNLAIYLNLLAEKLSWSDSTPLFLPMLATQNPGHRNRPLPRSHAPDALGTAFTRDSRLLAPIEQNDPPARHYKR
jgi:hypothetical protein